MEELSLEHPDRVLTRFDEITLLDIVHENVGAIKGLLFVKTRHLPESDVIHLKVEAEVKKLNEEYRQLDVHNQEKLKAFSRKVNDRLRGIRNGEI
jgi:hypothetical protein